MPEPTMKTVTEIKEKADDMELRGVDFLDKHGNYCSGGRKKWKQVKTVRLHFVDGDTLDTTPEEFTKLGDYKFRMRPPDHA